MMFLLSAGLLVTCHVSKTEDIPLQSSMCDFLGGRGTEEGEEREGEERKGNEERRREDKPG